MKLPDAFAPLALHTGLPEAQAMWRRWLAVRLGLQAHQLATRQPPGLTDPERQRLQQDVARLLNDEPLQYVLGRAPFRRLELQVGPGVLIPRPETEELVGWVLDDLPERAAPTLGADLGTGSGCIPLALATERPGSRWEGFDASPEALRWARINTLEAQNQTGVVPNVEWRQLDWWTDDAPLAVAPASLDVMVSNPPYIPPADGPTLHRRVRQYEPHQALFSPDAEALDTYRRLLQLALLWLKPGGRLYLEVHSPMAQAVVDCLVREAKTLTGAGCRIELRNDLQGQPRMIRLVRP